MSWNSTHDVLSSAVGGDERPVWVAALLPCWKELLCRHDRRVGEPCSRFGCVTSKLARNKSVSGVTQADTGRSSFITKLVHRILKGKENVAYKNTPIGLFVPFPIWASQPVYTRVGTLIVATIYLQLIQNSYMFRSFTVLQCSHQHCVQGDRRESDVF